jgi:hypothetical protein
MIWKNRRTICFGTKANTDSDSSAFAFLPHETRVAVVPRFFRLCQEVRFPVAGWQRLSLWTLVLHVPGWYNGIILDTESSSKSQADYFPSRKPARNNTLWQRRFLSLSFPSGKIAAPSARRVFFVREML